MTNPAKTPVASEGWFRPKRNGFGSGPPNGWQGWFLTGGYMAVMATVPWLARHSEAGGIAFGVAATVSYLLIVARTTRGGWRWRRNGKPE